MSTLTERYKYEKCIQDFYEANGLPPALDILDIVTLWAPSDIAEQKRFRQAICTAYKTGLLKAAPGLDRNIGPTAGPVAEAFNRGVALMGISDCLFTATRDQVKAWLKLEGNWPLPTDMPLAAWLEPTSGSDQHTEKQTSIQKRREACLQSLLDGWEASDDSFNRTVVDRTREEMRAKLSEKFPDAFPPMSKDTFADFWKKQKVCELRAGRRKGG